MKCPLCSKPIPPQTVITCPSCWQTIPMNERSALAKLHRAENVSGVAAKLDKIKRQLSPK